MAAEPRVAAEHDRELAGVEGNRRLTTLTAIVLLVLLAVEGLTVLAGVRSMLSVHVFVGMLPAPADRAQARERRVPVRPLLHRVGAVPHRGSASVVPSGPRTRRRRLDDHALRERGGAHRARPGDGIRPGDPQAQLHRLGNQHLRARARPPPSAPWRRDRRVAHAGAGLVGRLSGSSHSLPRWCSASVSPGQPFTWRPPGRTTTTSAIDWVQR